MPDRPHLVFVVTDQQRYDTVGALGFDHVDTPNLDRLVEEGVAFTDCHVTAPSCAPSRASLFTGYYPHTTGILRNNDQWRHSWVGALSDAGYHCVNVGKMHTHPLETPMDFDERYVVENKDRYLNNRHFTDEWDKMLRARGFEKPGREQYRDLDDYEERMGAVEWPLPEDAHSDVFVGDTAVWWLDEKPEPDGPLFLQVGFPGPHPPYDPTPEHAERYLDRDLPVQEVTEADLEGQPPPLDALREHNEEVDHDSVVHHEDPPREWRHRQRAHYLANVTMIDEQVGKLLDALDRNGYLEDAVVVFTSDHGDTLGDHGHVQKWTMYDAVTRVPLLARAPDRFSAGHRVTELCQLMDVGPALLELAGVEVPESMEARSLLPALRGEEWDGREYVYAEQGRDGILQETEFVTMVRSEDWKLVHFLDEPFGQLFDLRNDPEERENLWGDPDAQGKKDELLAELREWRVRSGARASDWAADCR